MVLWSLVLGSPTLSRPVPLPCHRLVAPRALAPVAGPVVGGLGAAGLIAPRAFALDAGPTDKGLVVAALVAHRALAPVAGPAVDGLGVSALKSPALGPSPVLQSLVSKSPPPPLPPSSCAPRFSGLSSPEPRSRPPPLLVPARSPRHGLRVWLGCPVLGGVDLPVPSPSANVTSHLLRYTSSRVSLSTILTKLSVSL